MDQDHQQSSQSGILWIQATLHPDNYVLLTNNLMEPEITSLSYDKFLQYMFRTFTIHNKNGMLEGLNTFRPVFLDCQSGNWRVITTKDIEEARGRDCTFDELYAMNPDALIRNEVTSPVTHKSPHQARYQSQIDQTYSFFTKLLRGNRPSGSNRRT